MKKAHYREFHNQFDDPNNQTAPAEEATEQVPGEGEALANGPEGE